MTVSSIFLRIDQDVVFISLCLCLSTEALFELKNATCSNEPCSRALLVQISGVLEND